jgi:hypothetical protein
MLHKALQLLSATWIAFVVLMVTHEGEFFPFSIYPMFSKAGHAWHRIVVRDVSGLDSSALWLERSLSDLPGEPVPLGSVGVETIDVADFINETAVWTNERRSAMRKLFGNSIGFGRRWMIYRVQGSMDASGEVHVRSQPTILLSENSATVGSHE